MPTRLQQLLALAQASETTNVGNFAAWCREVSGEVDSLVAGVVPSGLSFANAAAASAFPTAGLETGDLSWVRTFRDIFALSQPGDAGAALPVDGVTVLAAAGGGTWVRLMIPSIVWTAVPAWGINTATGNDENAGTVASPLRTGAELGRRLKGAVITQRTDVTIIGDQVAGDILDLEIKVTTSGSFFLHGTPVPFLTEAVGLTSVTAIARGVGGGNALTVIDTNLAGTWAALGLVGKRGRITGGNAANIGALFWVAKDENAVNPKQARLSPTGKFALTVPVPSTATLVTPSIGDTFVIETLPSWPRVRVDVHNDADEFTTNLNAIEFVIDSLALSTFAITGSPQIAFVGCDSVHASQCGPVVTTIVLSKWIGGTTPSNISGLAGFSTIVLACLATARTTVQVNGVVVFDQDTLGQGATLLRCRLGGLARCGNCCSFDATGDGFQISADGAIRNDAAVAGGSTLYGSGATGVGVSCQGRFEYLTGTRPTVTGALGDFKIGTFTTTYPFDDAATRTFLAPIATTWPNLAAASGAAGFGDHVFDPRIPGASIEGVAAFL